LLEKAVRVIKPAIESPATVLAVVGITALAELKAKACAHEEE